MRNERKKTDRVYTEKLTVLLSEDEKAGLQSCAEKTGFTLSQEVRMRLFRKDDSASQGTKATLQSLRQCSSRTAQKAEQIASSFQSTSEHLVAALQDPRMMVSDSYVTRVLESLSDMTKELLESTHQLQGKLSGLDKNIPEEKNLDSGLQKVSLIGVLGRDARTFRGKSGHEMLSLRLLVSDSARGETTSTAYDILSFCRDSSQVAALRKGARLFASGTLSVSLRQREDGKEYLSCELFADTVMPLD